MRAICDDCGHEFAIPTKAVARLYPPAGAEAFVSLQGCENCEGRLGGAFCWLMEDGTKKHGLAGMDELEAQGVSFLEDERFRQIKSGKRPRPQRPARKDTP